jgi:hypothetical protein
MNSAAAAAIFSGSPASGRCARGRTSSFHRPAGLVTQRRRHGTGQQSGGGKRPHPGRGHPPRTQIALPRQRARPHPAATTPLIRPTPAPAAAATPRQTPARRAGDRDARQRPAHARPPPLLRPRPAGRHHCAARHSHHQYAPASLSTAGAMLAVTWKHQGTAAPKQPPTAHPPYAPQRGRQHAFCQVAAANRTGLRSRERRFESYRGHCVISQDIEDTVNPRSGSRCSWFRS